jgi:RNA polymerase sigma-70 factor (ECF subfamily)
MSQINKHSAASGTTPDAELLKRVVKGDNVAFAEVMRRFTPMAYSVAYRMYSQKSDAEDVVQDAFLKLWDKAHLYDETKGAAVSTWFYRMVYNLCIDLKRKEKGTKTELNDHYESKDAQADQAFDEDNQSKRVRKAVMTLPARQRAALILCHFEGHSNEEAATIMETTVKGVEGLLVRARKTLQETLKAEQALFKGSW